MTQLKRTWACSRGFRIRVTVCVISTSGTAGQQHFCSWISPLLSSLPEHPASACLPWKCSSGLFTSFNTPTFSFNGYLHTAWDSISVVCSFSTISISGCLAWRITTWGHQQPLPPPASLSHLAASPYSSTHHLLSVFPGEPRCPISTYLATQARRRGVHALQKTWTSDSKRQKAQHKSPTRSLPPRLSWAVLGTEYLLRYSATKLCFSWSSVTRFFPASFPHRTLADLVLHHPP